jgi:hypothetical protein
MARHRRPAYEWEITPASHVDVLDLIVGADDGALEGDRAGQRPRATGSGVR